MTGKPLVSVIINCYNSEKYLRETIDSLLAQTYENWEAIFWDNCSTDKTAEIIKNYDDPRFKYFLAEMNTPLGEARNLAMYNVKGDYFCFMDSDDIWVPDFLHRGVEILGRDLSLLGYFGNFYYMYNNKNVIRNKDKAEGRRTFAFLLRNYDIGMSGCILRRKILSEYNERFDDNYQLIEDMDFFLKAASHGDLYHDNQPCFYYRVHSGSASFRQLDNWLGEFVKIRKDILDKYINGSGIAKIKDLKRIDDFIVLYRLAEYKRKKEKKKILKLMLNNVHLANKSWPYLIYTIIGDNIWNLLKSKL